MLTKTLKISWKNLMRLDMCTTMTVINFLTEYNKRSVSWWIVFILRTGQAVIRFVLRTGQAVIKFVLRTGQVVIRLNLHTGKVAIGSVLHTG